ncbi:DUF58 domain-containing protein [Ningiella sp. W23]|uniref:DUF58 domain-containing protein n=1 Tax=Ningiella sp. W23 TaxID=3023715 RepID=UPI0037566523
MQRSINAFRNTWLTRRNHWLDKRIPAENKSRFNLTNTFILPSSFGWAIICIVAFLFILGTNYQNNIVLGMSYFFSALLLLSLFHSYQFFTQHSLEFLPFEADFENRDVVLRCRLFSQNRYPGGEFVLRSDDRTAVYALDEHFESTELKLNLAPMSRGLHLCKRIKVECFFGFGLYRCWSYLQPKHQILVYPSARKTPIQLHQSAQEDDNEQSQSTRPMQADDLQGIRNHIETDPVHHVSWKHVAKGQGLLTKDFSVHSGISGWLRLSDHVNTLALNSALLQTASIEISENQALFDELENGLRALSYQVQELSRDKVEYGLDLGATKILPQASIAHLDKCLFHLATFGHRNKMNRRAEDARA